MILSTIDISPADFQEILVLMDIKDIGLMDIKDIGPDGHSTYWSWWTFKILVLMDIPNILAPDGNSTDIGPNDTP